MTEFKNRLGHDNFVWWIGVVEDRVDPLNLGRCRVRIFGSHTDNLQEIPTSQLPWATPIFPVNDSKSFSTPLEGDYVFGFFMDGLSSQAPAMIGVFPAIPQENPDDVEGKGFHARAKYTNSETKESDAVTPIVYTDTPAAKPVRKGEPTTPATAWTKIGTGIEKSDKSRAHVCDIANNIKFQQAVETLKASTVFQTIRTSIEEITSAISSSALATQIVQAVKVIRGYLKMIKEFLEFVNEVILEIASYVAYVQEKLAWILSAPARLLQLLRDCITEITRSLTTALSLSTAGIVSQIKSVINSVQSTVSTAVSTVAQAQAVASQAAAALNPKSYSGSI